MKIFLTICLLAAAALVGFCLTPPMPSGYFHLVRFLDAALAVLLGLLVWSAFRVVEPAHFGRRWMVIRSTTIPVVWLVLVWLLAILFRYMSGQFYEHLFELRA
jgi:hypothetical protein